MFVHSFFLLFVRLIVITIIQVKIAKRKKTSIYKPTEGGGGIHFKRTQFI